MNLFLWIKAFMIYRENRKFCKERDINRRIVYDDLKEGWKYPSQPILYYQSLRYDKINYPSFRYKGDFSSIWIEKHPGDIGHDVKIK